MTDQTVVCSGLTYLGRFDEDRRRLVSSRAILCLCYAGMSDIISTGLAADARFMEIAGI